MVAKGSTIKRLVFVSYQGRSKAQVTCVFADVGNLLERLMTGEVLC